jgi:hypothetical protein
MSRSTQLTNLAPIRSRDRIRRLLWDIVRLLIYRPTPVYMHRWRCRVLRAFGATVHEAAVALDQMLSATMLRQYILGVTSLLVRGAICVPRATITTIPNSH